MGHRFRPSATTRRRAPFRDHGRLTLRVRPAQLSGCPFLAQEPRRPLSAQRGGTRVAVVCVQMNRRRLSARVAVLALCAACNFDPSALSGGPSGGIGGDHGDGGAASDGDAMSVLDGASPPPDATPACNATSCPGECDQDGVCNILCGSSGGELREGSSPPPCDAVVCPPDIPCYVHCIGQDACAQPIDCTQSTSCRIDCTDDRSCGAQLTCGPGLCEIHCDGGDSCQGGLNCQSSCFCDVSCQGDHSCNPQTVCPPGCDADPDCKTSGAGCADSC